MRSQAKNKNIVVALVSAVVLAVPAAAAGQQTSVLGDSERREQMPERAEPGPFHPVVGQFDYGTAENAFGAARSGHVHAGHDIFSRQDTQLVAPADGIVVEAGADGGRGNYLSIYDRKRDLTYNYFHLAEPALQPARAKLDAGQRVGSMGCTGSCWGVHLHFEVRKGGDPYGAAIDPLPLLQDWKRLDKPL